MKLKREFYRDEHDNLFTDAPYDPVAEQRNQMLDSFMTKAKQDINRTQQEIKCDYGWLEPNGTFHAVEWGLHGQWANEYLDEHYPFDKCANMY